MVKKTAARFTPPVLTTAVVTMMIAWQTVPAIPRGLGIAGAVLSWIFAIVFERREVRMHASVVVGIAAITAVGQVRNGGIPYGVACGIYIVGCLVATRTIRAAATDPGVTRPRPPLRVWAILFGIPAVITTALIAGLPPLGYQVERRMMSMLGGDDNDEASAFSTRMVLGSTKGMFQSDRIVMRIEGDKPDYIRGAVYDRYQGRFWATSPEARVRNSIPTATTFESSTTKMMLARGTPVGEDMRWFLPAGACDLALPAGQVDIDRLGVARRSRKAEEPLTIGLRTTKTGCLTRPPSPVANPAPEDVGVPTGVLNALTPIANQWTKNATTDHEKLNALVRELGKFEYSLSVKRDEHLDAIVDFVTVHRAGHCEMFASAMVLMARTQNIPARVVGGYRVTEVNPITGLAIVRDRNAHTWVEAWVDGAWRGFDPTPTSESLGSSGNVLDYLGDIFSAVWDRAVAGFARLGALGIAAILGAITAVLVALRAILRWARTTRSKATKNTFDSSLPLRCFVDLTSALAAAGHPHDPSEPIESFAKAIETLDRPWSKRVATALSHYAEYRYGNVGNEDEVIASVTRAAKSVS